GSTTDTLLTGEDNPLPTKDESVEARLQAIEQTQSQILDKLNDTIDTRLTGSNVEYIQRSDVINPMGAKTIHINDEFDGVTEISIYISTDKTFRMIYYAKDPNTNQLVAEDTQLYQDKPAPR